MVELANYPNYFITANPPKLFRKRNGILIECRQSYNSKKDPYMIATVYTPEGKKVKQSMHRLLMETFVPNIDNKAHVNHIDGNKSNNDLSNLEWATPQENALHAVRTGLLTSDSSKKPVHQYSLSGIYLNSYESDVAAEKATGVAKQNISKATLGLRLHAGYYQWSRIKYSSLEPVETLYIKEYVYNNEVYPSLAALAKVLGYANPESIGFSHFSKHIKNSITKVYYN